MTPGLGLRRDNANLRKTSGAGSINPRWVAEDDD